MCVRDTGGVSWEDVGVVDLARDPSLHKSHVLEGRELNRLSVSVEPSKGVVTSGGKYMCRL